MRPSPSPKNGIPSRTRGSEPAFPPLLPTCPAALQSPGQTPRHPHFPRSRRGMYLPHIPAGKHPRPVSRTSLPSSPLFPGNAESCRRPCRETVRKKSQIPSPGSVPPDFSAMRSLPHVRPQARPPDRPRIARPSRQTQTQPPRESSPRRPVQPTAGFLFSYPDRASGTGAGHRYRPPSGEITPVSPAHTPPEDKEPPSAVRESPQTPRLSTRAR